LYQFIAGLPKVELHLHIEGSLEPELMFELAQRNNIDIPFANPDEVRAAYDFSNLQSFLDIYYQGAQVLITERDFYDLTWAYMLRCKADNVLHAELFFDPQTHTARGIGFDTVMKGLTKALAKAEAELGISSQLILCFLRHLDELSAFDTLQQAQLWKEKIVAVGLDSSEVGHPPEKFARVFAAAREQGYLTVAHAGEEGPSSNIIDALDILQVSRIDHGVRCVDDPQLVARLVEQKVHLTICPLSNTKLKVFDSMDQHNIVDLLRQGVSVGINADDPAYFGGYMNDNFNAVASAHTLSHKELANFTYNAIDASFCSVGRKYELHQQLQAYVDNQ
jgi:adenosine deaminase|tara:strand:- start:1098 stop:2102 length:1005 start_codon:yes stop_codon:yes gene_type:complete